MKRNAAQNLELYDAGDVCRDVYSFGLGYAWILGIHDRKNV